nr:hypothetical protein [Nanoarchaeum sp.]
MKTMEKIENYIIEKTKYHQDGIGTALVIATGVTVLSGLYLMTPRRDSFWDKLPVTEIIVIEDRISELEELIIVENAVNFGEATPTITSLQEEVEKLDAYSQQLKQQLKDSPEYQDRKKQFKTRKALAGLGLLMSLGAIPALFGSAKIYEGMESRVRERQYR